MFPERYLNNALYSSVRFYTICNGSMEIVLSCFLIYYVFNSSGRTSGQRRKNEEEDIRRERSTGFKNIDSGPKEIVFEDVEASYKSVSKVRKSNNGTKLSTVVSS